MATLDDDDKAEIAEMIAEASKRSTPPTRAPRGEPPKAQGEWEQMTDRDRQTYVRQMVEEANASLDAEYERESLKRENEELKKKVADWEKQGKKGARPTRASLGDGKAEEAAPSVVSKAYKWLFGEATAPR